MAVSNGLDDDKLCILATLDDNDYGARGGGDKTQLESPQDAVELFKDFFQPTLVSNTAAGTYQSYQWTDHLQIILLDLRCSSSPRLPGIEPGMQFTPDYHDTTKTWLGADQWRWLEKEITTTHVNLRLIVSPLQVLATGHSFDCWNQLPYERIKLLKLLKSSINNNSNQRTILLSGDRHVSALYSQDGLHEITSSSLTHTVPLGMLEDEHDVTRQSPFTYENNFGVLELGQDHVLAKICSTRAGGEILQQWHLQLS
ncbi:PhoD-like phosphatase [Fragilaria crotonensis]|nr:PhoD-like phosphatase [Fragilaria crotonensis]